jgi:hypothetical protein
MVVSTRLGLGDFVRSDCLVAVLRRYEDHYITITQSSGSVAYPRARSLSRRPPEK